MKTIKYNKSAQTAFLSSVLFFLVAAWKTDNGGFFSFLYMGIVLLLAAFVVYSVDEFQNH